VVAIGVCHHPATLIDFVEPFDVYWFAEGTQVCGAIEPDRRRPGWVLWGFCNPPENRIDETGGSFIPLGVARPTEGGSRVNEFAAVVSSASPDTVEVAGELDMATAPQLEAVAADVLSTGRGVTIDMGGVTFVDSSGLGAVLRIASSLDGQGPLRLVNVPPLVARVIQLTGLEGIGTIEFSQASNDGHA
jgi:anti-sigma B factor antagonist